MTELGVVKFVHAVAGGIIVGVSLKFDLNQVSMIAVSICFGSDAYVNKVAGYKYWQGGKDIDLIFDGISCMPEIGSTAFVVK